MDIMFSGLKKYMEIRDFIVKNWQFISSALVILVTIIFAFVKRRPVSKIIDGSCYETIVNLIKEAEVKYGSGNGDKKLEFVLDSYIKDHLNISDDLYKNIYRSYLKNVVNSILDTPQRKEKK